MSKGLYTRILKDGTKRYEVRCRLNGKPVGKRFKKRKKAVDWLARMTVDVNDGTYRDLRKGNFGQYIDHWKDTYLLSSRYKPSTLQGYRCGLERLITEFEYLPMTGISAAEINSFSAKLLKKDLSPKTVRNSLTLLNKILKDAIADGYIRHTPMEAVRMPKISKKQKGKALKIDEIQTLLKEIENRIALLDKQSQKAKESVTKHYQDQAKNARRFRLLFMTALLTGIRRGELFGLGWEHIDWEDNIIKVRRALYLKRGKYHDEKGFVFVDPKTENSRREIDLSQELKKELLKLWMSRGKPNEGLVFCTEKGNPLDADNVVKNNFLKLLKAAELGKWEEVEKNGKKVEQFRPAYRWHDLRHTYGSLKLAHESVYYVQRQMGHSSISITCDIYGHLLKERKPEAAAKTDQMVFGSEAAK